MSTSRRFMAKAIQSQKSDEAIARPSSPPLIERSGNGRRFYLRNTPFTVKETIKLAGGKWDPAERCWYFGVESKARECLAMVSRRIAELGDQPSSDQGEQALDEDSPICGRALYRGAEYLLVNSWVTKENAIGHRLCFKGRPITFVVIDIGDPEKRVNVTKRYDKMTYGKYMKLRAEWRDRLSPASTQGDTTEVMTCYRGKDPNRVMGQVVWLRLDSVSAPPKAMVVVGIQSAQYLTKEEHEDRGFYGWENGWYGWIFYGPATEEQYMELQRVSPRADADHAINTANKEHASC